MSHARDKGPAAISRRAKDFFSRVLHCVEAGLAALTLVIVMLGLWFLLKDLVRSDEPQFSVLQPATGRETSSSGVASDGKSGGARRETGFERLLSAVLLLAVGVELAILLIRHTPESLIELMFFVIARRILLKTDEFYELLMGVAALAGVFAVRKYLLRGQPHRPAVE